MTGIKHRIYARHQGIEPDKRLDISVIKRCVRETLRLESVLTPPCEVSVLITDDGGIRAINEEYRGVDKPTDVLSFPMMNLTPGAFFAEESEVDPQSGFLLLGDIVLSADKVIMQASEFGHSRERETAYLTIHSVLHLLGYDHMDEGEDKARMRAREKLILDKIGFADENQF